MRDEIDPRDEAGERDRALLAAVDRLAAGEAAAVGDREVVEVLAGLAWTVEERQPSPSVRRRIVNRVRQPLRPGSRGARPAWLLPVAASIVVALLALSGWQQIALVRQGRQIAELTAATAAVESPLVVAEEVVRQRRLLAMMTAEGSEFCLLRPAGPRPAFPAARGTLVVSPDRANSYLRLRGLGPAGQDGGYRVWFYTADGPRPGPWFEVDAEEGLVELESDGPPEGLRAVSVTWETDRRGSTPSGPRVLYADEAMTLL